MSEAKVNEHWLSDIKKVKKAYFNRKSDYNNFKLLDKKHTGGGHRPQFVDEDLMENLAGADNPSADPQLIIENGVNTHISSAA